MKQAVDGMMPDHIEWKGVNKHRVELGLTKEEAVLYEFLLETSQMTAAQLAAELDMRVQVVYQHADSLRRKGFVMAFATRPKEFSALPVSVVVQRKIMETQQVIHALRSWAGQRPYPAVGRVRESVESVLVHGKRSLHDTWIRELARASSEVLVLSEQPISDSSFENGWRRAAERGVRLRNLFLYRQVASIVPPRLVGAEYRRSRQRHDYYLSIFDGKIALLNIQEHVGDDVQPVTIVLRDSKTVHGLRKLFDLQWKSSPRLAVRA